MLFDDDYQVLIADTTESKRIHYALRYQVYCLETKFESSDSFLKPLEYDSYDEHSIPFIVKHRHSGEFVAAMRLIVGRFDQMPVYDLVSHDKNLLADSSLAMEISRVCVISDYRKATVKNTVFDQVLKVANGRSVSRSAGEFVDKKKQPEILLGLIRAAYYYSIEHKIDTWFFTITRALSIILKRLRLNVFVGGDAVDYHGIRIPHYCHKATLLDYLPEKKPQLFDMFQNSSDAFSLFSDQPYDLAHRNSDLYFFVEMLEDSKVSARIAV